jgi:Nitroreductase family
VRHFRDQALTKVELGQLLWAAQGVTGPDGCHAVSSAGALYPLELYVLVRNVASLTSGIYRYQVGLSRVAFGKARI